MFDLGDGKGKCFLPLQPYSNGFPHPWVPSVASTADLWGRLSASQLHKSEETYASAVRTQLLDQGRAGSGGD